MDFDPNNHIIQLCLQGMSMVDQDKPEEADGLFLRAWNEAMYDFEKFLAAFFIARYQKNPDDKLHWFETTLQLAETINNEAVKSALPTIYTHMDKCYEDIGDSDNANRNMDLANSYKIKPEDKGPFYHGTKADLQTGDFLTAGNISNYNSDITMNHIYFTALMNGAGLAAALAKGDGRERVYIVEPTGPFENDPNVTDKKFPGNLTRSYRTQAPLKIVGEITDWAKQTPQNIQHWRDKLANNKGDIIN